VSVDGVEEERLTTGFVNFNTSLQASGYDPLIEEEHNFTVVGEIGLHNLPPGITNPDNIPMIVSVDVTVSAALPLEPPSDHFVGSGTADDPFILATAADLFTLQLAVTEREPVRDSFAHAIMFNTSHYRLGNNIDMATDSRQWTVGIIGRNVTGGVAPFAGVIDGGGHAIHNLTGTSGLLGMQAGGTVRNLGLVDVNIVGTPAPPGQSAVGAIANGMGIAGSTLVIENSYVTGQIDFTGMNGIGGLVGMVGFPAHN